MPARLGLFARAARAMKKSRIGKALRAMKLALGRKPRRGAGAKKGRRRAAREDSAAEVDELKRPARGRRKQRRKRAVKRRRVQSTSETSTEDERAGPAGPAEPAERARGQVKRRAHPHPAAGVRASITFKARARLIERAQHDMRTAWGRTQSVAEWAGEWVIPVLTLVERLERGLSLEESLTGNKPRRDDNAGVGTGSKLTVNGETRSFREWADAVGITPDALTKRLEAGWDPVEAVSTPGFTTNRKTSQRYAIRAGEPGSWSWYDLPYERDVYAQQFVTLHPDGGSFEEIGAVMGIETSWACEIEKGAMKKIRALLDDGEITEAELIAALAVFKESAPPDWDGEAPPPSNARRKEREELGGPRIERWEDVPEVPEDSEGDGDGGHGVTAGPAMGAAPLRPRLAPPPVRFNTMAGSNLSARKLAQIKRWAATSSREDIEALERWA